MTTATLIGYKPTRAILVAALTMVAALVAVPPSTMVAAQSADTGFARFGHFAPSADPVNILMDGEPFADNIGFKMVSAYVEVPAGVHEFELRLAADPEGPAALAIQAEVPADGSVTIGAVTTRDGIAPQVYTDELASPAEGRSLVRFIHAAPDAAAVDIMLRGGDPLVADVPYPEASDYIDIASGSYDVEVHDSETDELVLEVAGWTVNPGEQSTIVVVRGTDDQLDVAPIVDAVAMSLAPAGGVQTGFGGMSDTLDPASGPPVGVVVGTLVAGLALAGIWRVGRRRPRTWPV